MAIRYVNSSVTSEYDKARLIGVYRGLRADINTMIDSIQSSINYLNNIDVNFEKYYSIDYSSADSKKIEQSRERLNQMLKYLRDIVIPAINSEIRRINNIDVGLQ